MKLYQVRNNNPSEGLSGMVLWVILISYIALTGFTMAHHELWGDEIHSWNIAKASSTIMDLIRNTRYEGHPPVWYFILWAIAHFTHNLVYVQVVHLIIASLGIFILLFFSPFSLIQRILIPFGYFFVFEYAVLSRNYAIAVLFTFCICLLMNKNFRYKYFLYYILLFLLSNSHLLGIVMAVALHFYFLWSLYEQKKKRSLVILHALAGLLILLPAVYFVFPPSDSSLGVSYWLQRWEPSQFSIMIKAIVKAFIPVPAWWEYHFWNTQFLLVAQYNYHFLKWIILSLSILITAATLFVLRKHKKSLVLFCSFLLLMGVFSLFLPFSNARQVGFIFVAFLASYWLYCLHHKVSKKQNRIVVLFLIFQLAGGIFAVTKDIKLPFSNAHLAQELINEIPAGNEPVTDYWCLNTLSAFADKPYYCVDLQKKVSFLMWNTELKQMLSETDLYSAGIENFMKYKHKDEIYMISIKSPDLLLQSDKNLFASFRVELADKREGAIEKGGNLYLYRISRN